MVSVDDPSLPTHPAGVGLIAGGHVHKHGGTVASDPEFGSLRELVMHYAARRGWLTQRRIAVMCGIDETAFSRFLDGKQDIGAVATYEVFRAIHVPIDGFPRAFELLRREQQVATALRGLRLTRMAGPARHAPAARAPVGRPVEAGRSLARAAAPSRPPSFMFPVLSVAAA